MARDHACRLRNTAQGRSHARETPSPRSPPHSLSDESRQFRSRDRIACRIRRRIGLLRIRPARAAAQVDGLLGGRAGPCLCECCGDVGKPFGVEGFGVEVLTDPLLRLGVALVRRVGESVQERAIAPWATHVFRWTASDGVDQNRVCKVGQRISDALDLDRALPLPSPVPRQQLVQP